MWGWSVEGTALQLGGFIAREDASVMATPKHLKDSPIIHRDLEPTLDILGDACCNTMFAYNVKLYLQSKGNVNSSNCETTSQDLAKIKNQTKKMN